SPRPVSPDLAVPPGLRAASFRAMGTDVLVLAPAGRAVRAARLVEELFEEWEAALSRFRPESELSRLNASAGLEVRVGPIVLAAVEAALDAARATAGLFDPTLLPDLVRVGYDRSFDEMGEPDSPAARPRGGGDWREIHVDRGRRTVRLPAGCGLDLGGVAKGMAVDAAIELLTATGLESALVDAGGDLRVHGLPPGGAPPLATGRDPSSPPDRSTHRRAGRERAPPGDRRGWLVPGRGGRRDGCARRGPAARPGPARAPWPGRAPRDGRRTLPRCGALAGGRDSA